MIQSKKELRKLEKYALKTLHIAVKNKQVESQTTWWAILFLWVIHTVPIVIVVCLYL